MNKPLRKGLSYTLSVTIGLGLLGGVVYYVGWRSILTQILALGVEGIVSVVGSVLLSMVAWLLSWLVILRSYGVRIPLTSLIGARLSGYAVSYLTPSLYFGGEPIRGLLVVNRTSSPATRIFATIVVERILGGLSLVVFVLMGSFYALTSPGIAMPAKRAVIIGVAFIAFWIMVGLINFAGNFKWISRTIRLLRYLFPWWQDRFKRAAEKVSETEDEIYKASRWHWRGTILAFLIQLFGTFFIYMRPQIFFYFSNHTTFSFPQLSLLFTLNIMLSSFLWITPGGLGTSEFAYVGIFRLVGIGKGEAVAFSLMFKFAELLFVAIGLAYLFNKGIGRLGRHHADRLPPCPAAGSDDAPLTSSKSSDEPVA